MTILASSRDAGILSEGEPNPKFGSKKEPMRPIKGRKTSGSCRKYLKVYPIWCPCMIFYIASAAASFLRHMQLYSSELSDQQMSLSMHPMPAGAETKVLHVRGAANPSYRERPAARAEGAQCIVEDFKPMPRRLVRLTGGLFEVIAKCCLVAYSLPCALVFTARPFGCSVVR